MIISVVPNSSNRNATRLTLLRIVRTERAARATGADEYLRGNKGGRGGRSAGSAQQNANANHLHDETRYLKHLVPVGPSLNEARNEASDAQRERGSLKGDE